MGTIQIDQVDAQAADQVPLAGPRVALLTPYSGGNLGDAAIQDSMILNLRRRLPGVQFLGITLNSENFLKQHGVDAFPLLATTMPIPDPNSPRKQRTSNNLKHADIDRGSRKGLSQLARIRGALCRVPGLLRAAKKSRAFVARCRQEMRHSLAGYRVLRSQDLLLFSGGGQLDEEYGGAWRLPLAYFKWALLARMAGIPCAMISIGAGRIKIPASRFFISIALRMCCYRSFRESKSRALCASLLPRATKDPVIPDLAFSLPDSELPDPSEQIRLLAGRRPIVALSPIAYAKPVNWPTPNKAIYDRYLQQMGGILTGLVQQGYFVVVVCSSLGDDETVIPDLLNIVGNEVKQAMREQIFFPPIKTWRDLVAVLRETDYLIASRLHGTILSFVSKTPVVAISFDPKVDWVMEDLKQSEYLLHITDFTADDALKALKRVGADWDAAVERISLYRQSIASETARQFEYVTGLALKHHQYQN